MNERSMINKIPNALYIKFRHKFISEYYLLTLMQPLCCCMHPEKDAAYFGQNYGLQCQQCHNHNKDFAIEINNIEDIVSEFSNIIKAKTKEIVLIRSRQVINATIDCALNTLRTDQINSFSIIDSIAIAANKAELSKAIISNHRIKEMSGDLKAIYEGEWKQMFDEFTLFIKEKRQSTSKSEPNAGEEFSKIKEINDLVAVKYYTNKLSSVMILYRLG